MSAVVETVAGRVAGGELMVPGVGPVVRFLGVPYAAPPVGDRRFRAPAPPVPWAGVRAVDRFGFAALQSEGVRSRLPSFSVAPGDEDCLTLNVWTPGTAGARPVFVWFHGGAFSSGASSMGVFDGARLATEHDVVVVTVNYRLGALGYLWFAADEDGVANCGLRDQWAALAWVRDHASGFGGDPDRITMCGESAGGGSVLHLAAARRTPPVRRAIVQSGEPRVLAPDLAVQVRASLCAAVGVPVGPGVAAALRAVPGSALVAAQDAVFAELGMATGLMPFHPTLDDPEGPGDGPEGLLVDGDPRAGFAAGRGHHLDLVIGTTRDELRLFSDPRADALTDADLATMLGRLAGPGGDGAAILATYRADDPGRPAARIWEAARTDAVLRVPALRVADVHTAGGGRSFVYRFDWEAPGIGAAHAVDVPFVFGTFDRDGWGQAVGADDRAEALGRELRTAWCDFARTGDPGWPRHDPQRRPTRCFGAATRVVDDPDGATRACW
ncbi:MAG: carboxylesterase family protein [Actinomycetes bacterium]